MEDKIKKYMNKEKDKLVSGKVSELNLQGVCPLYIESVFGDFEDTLDLNGYEGDYWGSTEDGFTVSGCMYRGTATISLEEE